MRLSAAEIRKIRGIETGSSSFYFPPGRDGFARLWAIV
jgi:hypothetical protein